jgi:protein-S-isoprenylcysteine O-methyltransferase Ste14
MTASDYGLWPLVVINTAVFIIFAFSFTKPSTARDWRSFRAFSAFVVALFTEMYGYPLTIYLLSGWLGSRFPALNQLTHNSGHLWEVLMGWKGDPHLNPLHLLSYALIGGGFILLASAWDVLYKAQHVHQLAMTGVYAHLRHPQYAAFVLIMLGFLAQWPTILTLLMFPILVSMYVRLAKHEEREAQAEFSDAYAAYAAVTPAFFPHRGRSASHGRHRGGTGTGGTRHQEASVR